MDLMQALKMAAGYPDRETAVSLQQAMQAAVQPIERDPNYEYGNILPFRQPVGGGEAEWSPGYSNVAKSLHDALIAPGRALQGNDPSIEDALNFALTVGSGGLATSALAPEKSMKIGMNAYHGTPHPWQPEPGFPKGRFRLDKVGEGEGVQRYGWGGYFAENPEVAGSYLRAGKLLSYDARQSPQYLADIALARHYGDKSKAIKELREIHDKSKGDTYRLKLTYAVNGIEDGTFTPNIMKLDFPDKLVAGKFLDWDQPLSKQPKPVREAALKALKDSDVSPGKYDAKSFGDWSGEDIYKALSDGASQEDVSKLLLKYGVPGLKYLDAGSRDAGKGSRNLVVWDQSVLDDAARKMP